MYENSRISVVITSMKFYQIPVDSLSVITVATVRSNNTNARILIGPLDISFVNVGLDIRKFQIDIRILRISGHCNH